MADLALRLSLLLMLLAWSGYLIYRLATGIFDTWKVGRFYTAEKNNPVGRAVRSSSSPIEFWFTLTFWHVMLVAFVAVFALCIYGIWRVVVQR